MKRLERTLSLKSVIAISISAMIGSGVFILPGLAMSETGSSFWLAYLVAALIVLPGALCTSELATAMPSSGGKYFYIDRTFGPLAGTVSGIGLWLILILKSSFALVGFGVYLQVMVAVPHKTVALTVLGFIVALNMLGIRKVSSVLKLAVGICMTGLLVIILTSVFKFNSARFAEPFRSGFSGFLSAVGLVFISFAGVTKIAAIAEEIKDPKKVLPLGIIISLGLVTLLYLGIMVVLVAVLPAAELSGDLHPVYLLASRVGGKYMGVGAAMLAILMMTSMANAGLLASSRFPFAMSRDKLLPGILSTVNNRFHTPISSILLSGVAMAGVIIFVDVEKIAKLGSAFLIMVFILVNFAVVVLRESDTQWYKPSFRTPLYPWIPGFGIIGGFVLLYVMGGLALLAAGAIALPGIILYLVYGRKRTLRRGVLDRMGGKHRRSLIEYSDSALGDLNLNKAEVVVVLTGMERSPETVVEAGSALAPESKLSIVHLTEVPEQAILDTEPDTDMRIESLERRLNAMSAEENIEMEFDSIVTRDFVHAVHNICRAVECKWVLKAWRRGGMGSVLLRNPLAWSLYSLPCNLALFKDEGVRYIRQIMVFAEPGPHDALIAHTADHLAKIWKASLTFVCFVPDGASEVFVQSQIDYIDEMRHFCEVESGHLVLRGKNKLQALVDATVNYDLLVMGEPEEGLLRGRLFKTELERLTELAQCSVLRLKTPRTRTHEALGGKSASTGRRVFNLMDFLDPRFIKVQMKTVRKNSLFNQFGKVFARNLDNIPAKSVTDALWARERMQNTAVEEGLALPHGTLDDIEKTYLGVFTTKKPVDYQAPDGRHVHIFFVTLGLPSARVEHLKLLSNLARLIQQPGFLDSIAKAQNPDEVLSVFRKHHANLELDISD